MKQERLPTVHPGEILFEEFMEPLAISQYRLAKDIHVTPIRISQIIRGKRSITADTALRLGKYFNMTPQFWLNMQAQDKIEVTQRDQGERSSPRKCTRWPHELTRRLGPPGPAPNPCNSPTWV